MTPPAAAARLPRPPAPGQALAVAAPAGAVDPEALAAGLAALRELAPEAELLAGEELAQRDGYLAGRDGQRARRLTHLMTQPEVGAVLSARGGFGASRLLPRLDLPALAAAGRLVVGFSDITALLNALAAQGLATVHGPVVTQLPRLDEPSRAELAALLSGRWPWPARLEGRGLAPGRAVGPLWGGNLTMVCHLLGTPWLPPLAHGVLLLEEVNEPPYRLDRLLTQLELAGVLDQVAGVALGDLAGPEADPAAQAELEAVAARRMGRLGKPVVLGLPLGHGARNRCLPLGMLAELDGAAGALTVGVDLA